MSDVKRCCAIYARVSNIEQIKGESVEGQLRMGREYADRQGWVVVAEYVDRAFSARTDDRPHFQRMISDALAGQIDIIIVESFDRFARNLEDAVTYKSLLRSNGVEIVSIMEPIDRSSPASIIQEGIADLFAEFYSANLSAKIRAGQRRAVERGAWPHRLPFGYVRTGDWIGISEAGALIALAFESFATGDYTLDSWTEKAWELGIRSPGGNRISPSRWSEILSNKFYIGVMERSGETFRGNHERLVDEETFHQVQRVLLANNHGKKPRRKRRYLLGGLLWSDDQNATMIGSYGRSHTGQEHRYYRCRRRPSSGGGKTHRVPAIELEEQIPEVLETITIPNEAIDDLNLDDPALALALRVAPNVGTLYPHLDTFDQRQALLWLVIARHGLHVSGDLFVDCQCNPPFLGNGWFGQIKVEPTRVELPSFYLWSLRCAA